MDIKLGQNVKYIGTKGTAKAAVVLATPETMTAGTSLPELAEGELHIAVWEFSDMHFVPRLNVKSFDAADAPKNEADEPVQVWATV